MLALLGPNGAGKSTLVAIACGLLKPDAGTVRVAGRPGVAFQEIGIYPSLTVRENLWAFAEVHGVSRRSCGAAARAVRADRAGRPARRAAERRRAAAAAHRDRARAPAAGRAARRADRGRRHADARGDPRRRAGASPRDGTAVVYTTHYLPEVEELGADVALLESGRVIAVRDRSRRWSPRTRRACWRSTYADGRVVRRPGASLDGLERRRRARRGHPPVARERRTWR